MKATPYVCEFWKPVVQHLPFGQGVAMKFLGGQTYLSDDSCWKGKRQYRTFYDRHIEANIWIDMADFNRRDHYFTGRYCDKQNQFVIKKLLREGDVFVDIGANFGIHTLLAARVVGSEGQVHAFEPQKKLVDVINAQIVLNGMSNVKVHDVGVGDEETELVLRNPLAFYTGTATLRPGVEEGLELGRVPVVRAEDRLHEIPNDARVLIKIDVEGFEYKALKGLQKLLNWPNVAVLIEITDGWLNEIGSSAIEVYQMLQDYGFEAYEISRTSLSSFKIQRANHIPKSQHDGLFIKSSFMQLS